jgi:peptidyl-prolyl cis-trans isomerase SurA
VCLIGCCGVVCAETLDRIVAVVNGDIILYSELQEQVRQLTKMSPNLKLEDPARRAQLEREVMQQMIRDQLADQEIKRLKIVVSAREIDEALETIKSENHFTDAQFENVIQQQGQTREQVRQGIKRELERSRLVERVFKSKTVITQEQVDAFLKTDEAALVERRRLALLFIPFPEGAQGQQTAEAEKMVRDVMNRLKGGEDFSKLAKEYSKGPAAQEGGDLGYIPKDELAPPIEAATRRLKPNEMTELLKTPTGFFIIKVLDVQKTKQAAVDAEAREKARRQLFQTEMSKKFEDWVRDLEARAFIQISL